MAVSIGLGVKADKASESEDLVGSAIADALRANGSGGVGRSFISYVLTLVSACLISSMACLKTAPAYSLGFSALATP